MIMLPAAALRRPCNPLSGGRRGAHQEVVPWYYACRALRAIAPALTTAMANAAAGHGRLRMGTRTEDRDAARRSRGGSPIRSRPRSGLECIALKDYAHT